jgi:pyrimidine-nucleoside phosphorylase
MISGRGLGHTGGTLDKLESIPGFRVDLSVRDYRRLVKDVGACLIGQTATLAPADKKLYALRDVTATVDCIPLIASSIMSKKMAEGIDALVLDVKVGSGAFMKTVENARTLAQTMIDIGRHLNRKVVALLTDMDQPLGDAIGNALEVKEATDVLKGCAPADLTEVTLALSAEMLVLGQKAKNADDARRQLKACIDDGSAMKKWEEIVEAQGGNPEAVRNTSLLPSARHRAIVAAPEAGFVTAIDSESIGLAAMALGAGRERVDSLIEPSVGFVLKRKVGASVQKGEALVEIHYNDEAGLENVTQRVLSAYQLGPSAPKNKPLVLERME